MLLGQDSLWNKNLNPEISKYQNPAQEFAQTTNYWGIRKMTWNFELPKMISKLAKPYVTTCDPCDFSVDAHSPISSTFSAGVTRTGNATLTVISFTICRRLRIATPTPIKSLQAKKAISLARFSATRKHHTCVSWLETRWHYAMPCTVGFVNCF